MTLKEIYSKYVYYGFSDEEIIKRYFIDNHIEHVGIELMNQLAQEQVKLLRKKIQYRDEWTSGLQSILINEDMSEQDKFTLYRLVSIFVFYRDLEEKELKEVETIFSRNKVNYCPIYFLAYLAEKGIWKKEVWDYWKDSLRLVRELREV